MSASHRNWSRGKKWAATIALGWVTFCVTFASSVLSPGTFQAAEEFGYEPEVMVLSTAIFEFKALRELEIELDCCTLE